MSTTKPKPERVQLPSHFHHTHETSGLPGYPAIDVFAPGGSLILAPEAGVIRRWSGRKPTATAVPGGPYGYSMYLKTATGDYFITHLSHRAKLVGAKVRRGQILGTIADYTKATNGKTPSHTHFGKRGSGVT
jgi:murein DD-endopeptidase MepM/ murein hydrolase activator NlpD